MTIKLDAKFYGEIRKVKDDTVVPDDEYMVFLAKDDAFPETLRFYRNKCIDLGCDIEHIQSVNRTMDRLDAWRTSNPHRLKVPDARGEKLLG